MKAEHLGPDRVAELLDADGLRPVGGISVIGLEDDGEGDLGPEPNPIVLSIQCPSGCCVNNYLIGVECAEMVANSILEALAMRKARIN